VIPAIFCVRRLKFTSRSSFLLPFELSGIGMPDDDKAQRSQKIAIDQLAYSLNLTLTYDVAALGYWFTPKHAQQLQKTTIEHT